MDRQQKFKEIFGNSNISDIIYFYKDNINNGDIRRNLWINNFNENKSYSFDNFKILKNRVQEFNKLKKKLILINDYLNNFEDNNDLKFRLSTIIHNMKEPIDKRYKKYKFCDLWLDFGNYLRNRILSYVDSDIYFRNYFIHGECDGTNIYKELINEYDFEIKNKKFGLNIFEKFIERLKI